MEVNLNVGGQLEVWRTKQLSERTAHKIARKANQNSSLTLKDLKEVLAESGAVVHCSKVKRHLQKYDLYGRVIRRKPLMHPHYKIQCQNFAKEHHNKPDAFWKQPCRFIKLK